MLTEIRGDIAMLIRQHGEPIYRDSPEKFVPLVEAKLIELGNTWLQTLARDLEPSRFSQTLPAYPIPSYSTNLITKLMKTIFQVNTEFLASYEPRQGIEVNVLSADIFLGKPSVLHPTISWQSDHPYLYANPRPHKMVDIKDLEAKDDSVNLHEHMNKVYALAQAKKLTDVDIISREGSIYFHKCFLEAHAPKLLLAVIKNQSYPGQAYRNPISNRLMEMFRNFFYFGQFPESVTGIDDLRAISAAASEFGTTPMFEWANKKLHSLEVNLNPQTHFAECFRQGIKWEECFALAERDEVKLTMLVSLITPSNLQKVVTTVPIAKYPKATAAILQEVSKQQQAPSTPPCESSSTRGAVMM